MRLQQILQQLIRLSQNICGRPIKRQLASGLIVTVCARADNPKSKVVLSRIKVAPSQTEINTIIKYWPIPVVIDGSIQTTVADNLHSVEFWVRPPSDDPALIDNPASANAGSQSED